MHTVIFTINEFAIHHSSHTTSGLGFLNLFQSSFHSYATLFIYKMKLFPFQANKKTNDIKH
ncbi:hypothetical protein XSR1_210028 [Xenorhabdus szentirmaii DSM 16338]|uniref:Uncharacterized protein n=1 Tax=Xenorhabdus szentirmaii DSM 16338 TaxID=1427518 RepID=W1IZF7_9GAMM|nr:hypothetical protein XSR1_210028 [Xenorhabdus szentirmaii DSM 16338]